MDHIEAIAGMTGTDQADWEEADGPDSRCGVDYYYSHKSGMWAWVNDDQGAVQATVFDIDGDEIAAVMIGDGE